MADRKTPELEREATALDALAARAGWKKLLAIALAVTVVVAPPIIWLVTRGSDSAARAAGPDAVEARAAGCELHTFEHGVTNDPEAGRAYEQEALFGSHPPLPRAGFQAGSHPPNLASILHSLAHGWLVVKYKRDLSAADRQRLRRFAQDREAVAVVPGGSGLSSGFAAIRWGHGLDCETAGRRAIAVLDEFERGVRASLPGGAPSR